MVRGSGQRRGDSDGAENPESSAEQTAVGLLEPNAGNTSAEVRESNASDAAIAILEANAEPIAIVGAETDRPALDVTIIRPGRSANGYVYSEATLRQSLSLWEGAAAFVDHPTALDLTRAGQRSLRDLVGVYRDARFESGIRATLVFYPTARWAYDLAAAAIADRLAGRPGADVGISADLRVRRRRIDNGWAVEEISQVVSADLVFQPSAGGTFDRVHEARSNAPGHATRRTDMASEPRAMAVAERDEGSDDANEEHKETIQGTTRADDVAATAEAIGTRADAAMASIAETRRRASGELLKLALGASELPEPARAFVRSEFEGQVFEADDLDRRMDSVRQMLGAVFSPNVVRGAGSRRSDAEVGLGPLERMQIALDRLFDLPIPDAHSAIPRLSGIREAYIALTGDSLFTGRPNWENAVVREANEVTTSVLANALANAMTKRIVMDYRAQPRWWDAIVVKTAIGDFKQQQRIHLNDFAALATVAENAAYTNLAWGDTRETYTPSKRGNMVVVTLESIVNDDTHAITRIPRKLAAAGVATINEFVAGLFTANAGAGSTMADTFSVFDAANHQSNAGTTALSTTTIQTALVTLLKMTNAASKRLGLTGRYLLTPPDLYFTARTILESVNLPGVNTNDVNPVRGSLTPISVPNWTDTNNWYVLADPGQIEMIEIGFLNGREEPELIVQDQPSQGSVFTNDALSWKVRHVFGGGWLDYRGAYGAIVA
ncbi:MAG: hypothetical protein EPO26_07710 [Chloroflexota bacterium]|nr:MAG: hypothetical protein EPO26_07710 [Chloroflexota bacterium]